MAKTLSSPWLQISEDLARRMRNWRRWWDGGQGAVYPSSLAAMNLGVVRDRYRDPTYPILSGEARDTEAALRRLDKRYAVAVRAFWLYEGRSLRGHARLLNVDPHTLAAWVIKGHELLTAELARARESWRRRRLPEAAARRPC